MNNKKELIEIEKNIDVKFNNLLKILSENQDNENLTELKKPVIKDSP